MKLAYVVVADVVQTRVRATFLSASRYACSCACPRAHACKPVHAHAHTPHPNTRPYTCLYACRFTRPKKNTQTHVPLTFLWHLPRSPVYSVSTHIHVSPCLYTRTLVQCRGQREKSHMYYEMTLKVNPRIRDIIGIADGMSRARV